VAENSGRASICSYTAETWLTGKCGALETERAEGFLCGRCGPVSDEVGLEADALLRLIIAMTIKRLGGMLQCTRAKFICSRTKGGFP
jgi:hypothetical protein